MKPLPATIDGGGFFKPGWDGEGSSRYLRGWASLTVTEMSLPLGAL